MAKPLVAIVGRPNVGKSMLFNKLVGRRLSIVEDTPGVTRDRLYAECEWRGRTFDLVDTGGIEPGTTTKILSFMRKQAEIAIQNATVIVFLCDIKTGLTAADQDVANMLLRARKPVVLAVNKMDQVGIKPPHFVCFCNDARLFHFSYQRYLENQIRATFGLEGTPVRLTIRQKGDKEG